jgi:NADP-dependent 3-hydroxy acid dehydrogenase YdfG
VRTRRASAGSAAFPHAGHLVDLDDLFETYDMNVRVAVQVVQAVLPGMIDAG